jgi:hypothetical protein
MHDNIFNIDIFNADNKNIEYIYRAEIPYHKKGMQLKIKKNILNLPIFRKPKRSAKGYRTLNNKSFKVRTWSRYIKRLKIKIRLKENLTQKILRRDTINAINNTNLSARFS